MSQKPILEKKNNLVFILEVLLVSPSKMPRNQKIPSQIIRLLKKEKKKKKEKRKNLKLPTCRVEKELWKSYLLAVWKNFGLPCGKLYIYFLE